MEDDTESGPEPAESLLPYEDWAEEAARLVMLRALQYAAANGLPGEHHFYITFRTDHPQTVIPDRLRAQYPEEMTIVLQHQFRDLTVDEDTGMLRVGLSFSGIPSRLEIPLRAVTAFADPHVRQGLRFRVDTSAEQPEFEAPPAEPPPAQAEAEPKPEPQVVSLDAFRRRTPTRE